MTLADAQAELDALIARYEDAIARLEAMAAPGNFEARLVRVEDVLRHKMAVDLEAES